MFAVWSQDLITGFADASGMKESMIREHRQTLQVGTDRETFALEAPEGDLTYLPCQHHDETH